MYPPFPMTRVSSNHRNLAPENLNVNALVIDPDCTPRFSIYSPDSQVSSRSSGHRSSPRNDFLSPPITPLVEVNNRDRRYSAAVPPQSGLPDARGASQFLSPQTNYHRLSIVPPSPRFVTPPESPIFSPPRSRPKILFYHRHDPHYGFTNFSPHSVIYKGKKYPTSEHLFQSLKFHDHKPGLAEHIRTCSERPSVAFSEARRFQPEARHDWKNVNIAMMDIVLELKFNQHPDLRDELLGTGYAELIEDSDKDAFWGVGPDGKGRNELGKALERLREKLRTQ